MDLVTLTTPALDSLNMAMSLIGGGVVPEQPGLDLAVTKVCLTFYYQTFLWNISILLCRWAYCWPWLWPRFFLGWFLGSSSPSWGTILTKTRGAGVYLFSKTEHFLWMAIKVFFPLAYQSYDDIEMASYETCFHTLLPATGGVPSSLFLLVSLVEFLWAPASSTFYLMWTRSLRRLYFFPINHP